MRVGVAVADAVTLPAKLGDTLAVAVADADTLPDTEQLTLGEVVIVTAGDTVVDSVALGVVDSVVAVVADGDADADTDGDAVTTAVTLGVCEGAAAAKHVAGMAAMEPKIERHSPGRVGIRRSMYVSAMFEAGAKRPTGKSDIVLSSLSNSRETRLGMLEKMPAGSVLKGLAPRSRVTRDDRLSKRPSGSDVSRE